MVMGVGAGQCRGDRVAQVAHGLGHTCELPWVELVEHSTEDGLADDFDLVKHHSGRLGSGGP